MSTKIAWTDETWNPVVGCSPVSPGCEHCYGARLAHRGLTPSHRGLTRITEHGPKWTGEVRLLPERFDQPLHWRTGRRIFVCSMSDLFHEAVPDDFIGAVFDRMDSCPEHIFQVLTKRASRMKNWVAVNDTKAHPTPENCWLGISIENQEQLEKRLPYLAAIPCSVPWISAEPLLGPLDFGPMLLKWGIKWMVIGGESGPGARPCDVNWIRSIVEQCKVASVPVFVKQLGAHPYEAHSEMDYCCDRCNEHPGKHPIGRLDADGITRPFKSAAASDPSEWPEDLRVREYPA